MHNEVDDLLRDLADDPEEYERERGMALFVRQGEEVLLQLKEMPGIGVAVEAEEGNWVPAATYVQQQILDLPRLSRQIVRTIDKAKLLRPGEFVEGPSVLVPPHGGTQEGLALQAFTEFLQEADPGSTRILQLMAGAGQGKTVLLEEAALSTARSYQPDLFPHPMVLLVDLLGRYVGTIEDAIAGSLNNKYLFPGLSQRDVVTCVRQRWLILALDGFDELVARVGARDAFNRITELLDQLEGSGTLVLSAREAFFDLYQITSAIRTYLTPRRGSYDASIMRLAQWSEPQGREVFRGLGSPDAEADLRGLLSAFESDRDIVFQPFFLTRLADLWIKGERFSGAGGEMDSQGRIRFVIETFIQREAVEKWVDRDGRPWISVDSHRVFLGAIAEEMWRSGAFRLDQEELRLAAEVGLASRNLAPEVLEQVLERVPQHAAFQGKDRGFVFIHDQFLYFFLGFRLAGLLAEAEREALRSAFSQRDLGPNVIEWLAWHWRQFQGAILSSVELLTAIGDGNKDTASAANVAHVCAALLDECGESQDISLTGLTFVGDALRNRKISGVTFDACNLWHIDLSNTILSNCNFKNCTIGDMRLDAGTRFPDCRFESTSITVMDQSDSASLFSPDEISMELERRGARTIEGKVSQKKQFQLRASRSAIDSVEQFVRASQRTCDVAVEDMEEGLGSLAREVARIGLRANVMRQVSKSTSGPRKNFVRFTVDRETVLRGQGKRTGSSEVEDFWRMLGRKHPFKA